MSASETAIGLATDGPEADDPATAPGGLVQADPVELHARPVRLRGSRVARALLRAAGWRVEFDGLPARQGVIVVYPHTSNWDFVVGLLAKWAIGIDASFWGKESLFRVPLLGRWMRWLGGVPVDRSNPGGLVGSTVALMQQAQAADRFFWLALAPEGTRSAAAGWRSGFHRVAVGAGVPLALATLDFGGRCVRLQGCWQPGGDPARDLAPLAERAAGVRGYRPHLAAPIRLR